MPSPWFITSQQKIPGSLKLFAVPYAGRGASLYYPWRALVPQWIELVAVQLPGREARLQETTINRIEPLIAQLSNAILTEINGPYALFGHSMGALVCFELTRRLRELGAPLPSALALSGHQSPTLPRTESPLHMMSDADFIAAMQERYDGIPQAVLDRPELLQLLLPTLRRDIEALEHFRFAAGAPLPVPFLLYGGTEDAQTYGERLDAWRELTSGPVTLRRFPGGHFYLQENPAEVVVALVSDLTRHASSGVTA